MPVEYLVQSMLRVLMMVVMTVCVLPTLRNGMHTVLERELGELADNQALIETLQTTAQASVTPATVPMYQLRTVRKPLPLVRVPPTTYVQLLRTTPIPSGRASSMPAVLHD